MTLEIRKLMEAVKLAEADITPSDMRYLSTKTQKKRRVSIRYKNGTAYGSFSYEVIEHRPNERIRYKFDGWVTVERHVSDVSNDYTESTDVFFDGTAGLVNQDNESYFDIYIETTPSLWYDKIEELEERPESKGKTKFEIFTQVLPIVIGEAIEDEAEGRPEDFFVDMDTQDEYYDEDDR